MVSITLEEKADELSAKYGMNRGKVYDILKWTEIRLAFTHLKEFTFHREEFYRNVYATASNQLESQRQSYVEKMSNRTQ